jgi:hypothetical protein
VVQEIAGIVQKAAGNPQIYGPDKYKTDNRGSYRAFEKHHYRVPYSFSNNIVRVLRDRHTSMEPLEINYHIPLKTFSPCLSKLTGSG